MTKEETIECIKIMQAYVDGENIEYWHSKEIGWSDDDYPTWNWADFDYRIKPKQQLTKEQIMNCWLWHKERKCALRFNYYNGVDIWRADDVSYHISHIQNNCELYTGQDND